MQTPKGAEDSPSWNRKVARSFRWFWTYTLPKNQRDRAYHNHLLQRCPKAVLIATSRRSLLPIEIRSLFVKHLETIGREKLVALAESVAKEESSKGRMVSTQEVLNRYNGYPGSLVAGVEAMKELFAQLEPESQAFLQVIPVLWDLGVRRLTIERLWSGYQDLYGDLPNVIQQGSILKELEKKGFLTLVAESMTRVSIPDSYREQVISPLIGIERPDDRLWNGFVARQDGDIFLEIGITWSEEYSEDYQSNPRAALGKAIAAYQQALAHYTPERSPLQYATTQNNLGNAYSRLANQFEDSDQACDWLDRAIACYKESLRFYTEKTSPIRHQQVDTNLQDVLRQAQDMGCNQPSPPV